MTTATRLVGAAASVVFVAGLATVAARGPAGPPAEDVPLLAAANPAPRGGGGLPPLDYGNDAVPLPAPAPRARPHAAAPEAERDDDAGGAGRDGWFAPDGRPGYSNGFGGCAPARVPGEAEPPGDHLLFEVTPVRDAVRPGERLAAVVSVTNTGSRRVDVALTSPTAVLLDTAGRAVSAVHWTDAMPSYGFDLEPGESAGFTVAAAAASCGDTARDGDPPLPEGDYELVVDATWYDWPDLDSYTEGLLVTERVPVRVAADAEPAPCDSYPDGCGGAVAHGWRGAGCAPGDHTGTPYGADRGLTVQVVPGDDVVRPGERVRAEVVVRNDGERAFSLLLLQDGDGLLRSAGGALGDGPGPLGIGDAVSGGRWSSERLPGGRVLRVPPGESASVPVAVETKECDGTPLPQGEYLLHPELYVAQHGWWQVPGGRVTLAA